VFTRQRQYIYYREDIYPRRHGRRNYTRAATATATAATANATDTATTLACSDSDTDYISDHGLESVQFLDATKRCLYTDEWYQTHYVVHVRHPMLSLLL
jgi:hypothetical protein